jgi:hypothetical protein
MGTCDIVPITHEGYFPFTLGHYRSYFKHSQNENTSDADSGYTCLGSLNNETENRIV